MNKLSSQLIVDILTHELSLPSGAIWLRDQNMLIPSDHGLYFSVGIVSSQVYSAISRLDMIAPPPASWDANGSVWDANGAAWDSAAPAVQETTETLVKDMVQIDVFSRANTALTRNWEVVSALNSIYSKQVQEANNFKIFRIPQSWLNTSDAEGSSILNRYTLTFPVSVWYRKSKTITGYDYYNDFLQRVDDEKTIGKVNGLIEFEIT